jgi:hypothetical protein
MSISVVLHCGSLCKKVNVYKLSLEKLDQFQYHAAMHLQTHGHATPGSAYGRYCCSLR